MSFYHNTTIVLGDNGAIQIWHGVVNVELGLRRCEWLKIKLLTRTGGYKPLLTPTIDQRSFCDSLAELNPFRLIID